MKKTASFLLSLQIIVITIVFCLIASACAEPFTLHSGVSFGMSHTEVADKEKNANFEVGPYENNSWAGEMCIRINGTIAGASGAHIDYLFNNNDFLHEAIYTLSKNVNYNQIFSTLQSKYGQNNLNQDWQDTWTAHSKYLSHAVGGCAIVYSIEQIDVSTWLIQQDNGYYVSIDLVYMMLSDRNGTEPRIYIAYSYFSQDEINKIINDAKAADEEYHNQMNDDL